MEFYNFLNISKIHMAKKYERNFSSMPRSMQGTNILCVKLGVTDKGILRVRIPGINQNYKDNSRFLKAIYGAQVKIWGEKKTVLSEFQIG